jgi:hypothetical protein
MNTTRRSFCYALGSLAARGGQAPEIKSLWIGLGKYLSSKTREPFVRVVSDPALAKFDALYVIVPPPTFADYAKTFLAEAEALRKRARRQIIYTSYTVGTEGWETSNHARAAESTGGGFLSGRNLPREKWFEQMATTGQWGLDIETMARAPSVDELVGYIRAFGQAAHARSQKAIVWYPVNWERFDMSRHIARLLWSKGAADTVDYVVWMDTKTLLEDTGEAGVKRRVQEVRDWMGEKAVFQLGLYGPEEETYAKARQFLWIAQEGGIRRFALWANPLKLDSPAFAKFYGELQK